MCACEKAHKAALSAGQEDEEQHSFQQRSGGSRGQGSATAELLRIKDHLIHVEKNVSICVNSLSHHTSILRGCSSRCVCCVQNASLQTESSLLKEQLRQLENQNTSLNNQIVALQRHTTTLQEQNTALHTQTAKVQVGAPSLVFLKYFIYRTFLV